MKKFSFEGGQLVIRYSRAYGYEPILWLETPLSWMNVPHPEDGITVGLSGQATTGGFEERGGFALFEQALEAGIEMKEAYSAKNV